MRGLSWSPDGTEVWFTAASVGGARALHAVSLSGRRRLVLRGPGSADPARHLRSGTSPAGARARARRNRGRRTGRGRGAGPLLARLVPTRGPDRRWNDLLVRRDRRGRRRLVRRLPARDRRIAGGAAGRRPRAGAFAGREVGAVDAADVPGAAGPPADGRRPVANDSDGAIRRDPPRGLRAGRGTPRLRGQRAGPRRPSLRAAGGRRRAAGDHSGGGRRGVGRFPGSPPHRRGRSSEGS